MRINCIPVEYLSDVHLRAEYREIILSIHYYKKSFFSKSGIDENRIPENYTLNKGHGYFWYNKFGYIDKRYNELLIEMKNRNYSTISIEEKFYNLFEQYIPSNTRNDWTPNKKDMIINLERILLRIYEMSILNNKQNYYKINGKTRTFLEWSIFYTEMLGISTDVVHNIITEIELKN